MRNPLDTPFVAVFQNEVLLNSKRLAPYVLTLLFPAHAVLWWIRPALATLLLTASRFGACVSFAHLFNANPTKGFLVGGYLSGNGWSILLAVVSLTTAVGLGWIISLRK